MPEVVVYILEGRTLEQKRGLVKDITQAVVKNAGTTAEQVTVSLVETPRTSKAKGGVLFSEMPGRSRGWRRLTAANRPLFHRSQDRECAAQLTCCSAVND